MLDETEKLPEDHGTNEALKAGGEVGGHTFDGSHGLGRNAFVTGAALRRVVRVSVIHDEGLGARG